jgi:hypothetical protein
MICHFRGTHTVSITMYFHLFEDTPEDEFKLLSFIWMFKVSEDAKRAIQEGMKEKMKDATTKQHRMLEEQAEQRAKNSPEQMKDGFSYLWPRGGHCH